MIQPLTKILIKIFANGFYRVHAGLFLFIGLVMVGAIPPQNLWGYEKALMLAFISGPIMMLLVFAAWLVYTLKATHYVSRQVFAINQQFLFYSSNSLTRKKQFESWFWTQFVIMLPISVYGLIAIFAAIIGHYYAASFFILLYLLLLTVSSAGLYMRLVNKLMDGSKQSFLLKISSKWRKPFFSLFVYHVFDKLKVTYIITKILWWLVITGVFNLFADVKHDVRVAGIAMLAIITAHVNLIYQEHVFQGQYLTFSRNLPYSYNARFLSFAKSYFILLLPEAIWVFSRFNPVIAFELLLFGLSMAMFFHCLLFTIDLNMDKYLQWVLGTFIVLFWIIMYRLIWVLIPINLTVAYLIFYRKYYFKTSI
ncbi:MAG TPA: hypothetical protein VGN20_27375 [Mucilaginibacter sp.]|jgi:hypothetical protein